MIINFSDGVATPETQEQLHLLCNQISIEEIKKVECHLLNLLTKIGYRDKHRYSIDFVDNIPLQIYLHRGRLNGPLQYGVHSPYHIRILKMSRVDEKKGKIGELVILAHEVGHALMGDKNYTVQDNNGTKVMEKMTDEALKINLDNREFPTFYEIYRLCRDTHHYKTKEGDFKEFFKDIISILEKEWELYKKTH